MGVCFSALQCTWCLPLGSDQAHSGAWPTGLPTSIRGPAPCCRHACSLAACLQTEGGSAQSANKCSPHLAGRRAAGGATLWGAASRRPAPAAASRVAPGIIVAPSIPRRSSSITCGATRGATLGTLPCAALLGGGPPLGPPGQHVEAGHSARQQQRGVGAGPVAEVGADDRQVGVLRRRVLRSNQRIWQCRGPPAQLSPLADAPEAGCCA